MSKITLLRVLLVAQWVLAFVGGVLDEVFGESLMGRDAYQLSQGVPEDMSFLEPVMGLILLSMLAGTVGLFMFKRVWYWIFSAAFMLSLAISPFMGDFIASGLAMSLYSLAGLLTGMVLVIGYDVTSKVKNVD